MQICISCADYTYWLDFSFYKEKLSKNLLKGNVMWLGMVPSYISPLGVTLPSV